MIQLKAVKQIRTNSNGDKIVSYSPRITQRKKIDSDGISDIIAIQSTFSKADVKGVIEALIENIPDFLLNNYSVCLDNFGTFSLHASTSCETTSQKVSSRNISNIRIAFRASTRIKKKLRKARFKKVT